MLLADEARVLFRRRRAATSAQTLEPFARVGFACESLKVTTRIMHIVAWLLTQRAVETGEIPAATAAGPSAGSAMPGQRSGWSSTSCRRRRSG